MQSTFIKSEVRTILIWVGLILFWVVNFLVPEYGDPYLITIEGVDYMAQDPLPTPDYVWFLYILAGAFLLTGCAIWAKMKNRHWAFLFWGFIAPIGLLGISLLKDKSNIEEAIQEESQKPLTPEDVRIDEDVRKRIRERKQVDF